MADITSLEVRYFLAAKLSFQLLSCSLQGFGKANHAVSTEKLKVRYPKYEITWADEGY